MPTPHFVVRFVSFHNSDDIMQVVAEIAGELGGYFRHLGIGPRGEHGCIIGSASTVLTDHLLVSPSLDSWVWQGARYKGAVVWPAEWDTPDGEGPELLDMPPESVRNARIAALRTFAMALAERIPGSVAEVS